MSSSRLALLRLAEAARASIGRAHQEQLRCYSAAAAAAAASSCGAASHAAASSPSTSTSTSKAAAAIGNDGNVDESSSLPTAYVFLGAPGVGKGTYSTRVADALGAQHVSAGDLVRAEVKAGTELGKQVAAAVDRGDLVPDSLVTDLVKARLASSSSAEASSNGEQQKKNGSNNNIFVLDGFPRTASQAKHLLTSGIARVPLALNLTLREQVLVDKCLGRRVCSRCGKGYNVADIMLPACEATGEPAVVMPPMPPPRECEALMEVRSDDNPATVRHRLGVYRREAAPLELVFREAGVLVDFPVTGGVRETLPRLMELFKEAEASSGASSGDEAGQGQRAA